MSQPDPSSVGRTPESSTPAPAAAAELDGDELSDAALDAVVGGLSVDAALSRAAAFHAGQLSQG